MVRRWCHVALLACLVGAAPASATDRLEFRPPTPAGGPLVSDGQRFVAYPTSTESVTVVDTRSGAGAAVALPAGCAPYGLDGFAIGGGQLLAGCESGPMLYDLEAQTWHAPPGFAALNQAQCCGYDYRPIAVGRHWLELHGSGYRAYFNIAFLNWRTGRLVYDKNNNTEAQYTGPFSATTVPDLDTKRVARPLCKPVRRAHRPYDFDVDDEVRAYFRDLLYDGAYGITNSPKGLIAHRCGGGEMWMAAEVTGLPAQLGAGLVTWNTDNRVYAYQFHTHRLFVSADSLDAAVVHTRNTVWITSRAEGSWSVREARLPERGTGG